MAENEKTEHYKIPKPHIENFISDDTPVLQMAFDIIDLLFREFSLEIAKKMDGNAELDIENIGGLTEVLANKMAKDRTFKLSEMTDVTGTENALDNYILTKSGAGFVLRSALAVIGAHTHDIANIVGLQAVLNTLAAGTSGVVDGEVTLFQGTGGKALKGSGVKLADLILSLDSKATSAQLTALSNAIADALSGKVDLDGNQTLTGGLTLPWVTVTDEDQPLYDNNVATKKYVDEAVASAGGLGVGQAWNDVSATRIKNTTYVNNTGKPIALSITGSANDVAVQIYINGALLVEAYNWIQSGGRKVNAFAIVPNGSSYSYNWTGSALIKELR